MAHTGRTNVVETGAGSFQYLREQRGGSLFARITDGARIYVFPEEASRAGGVAAALRLKAKNLGWHEYVRDATGSK